MELVEEEDDVAQATVANALSESQRLKDLQKKQKLSSDETQQLKMFNELIRSWATYKTDREGSGGSSAHGTSSRQGLLRECECLNVKHLIKLCVCLC